GHVRSPAGRRAAALPRLRARGARRGRTGTIGEGARKDSNRRHGHPRQRLHPEAEHTRLHVLPVPRHLPVEPGEVTADRLRVAAITLDFGNTLVRVDRAGLRAVVEETVDGVSARGIVTDRAGFLIAWAEERERQFREEVPEFREVDVAQRAVRVLARLRGMEAPAPDARWDDAAAALLAQPDEVDALVGAYS